MTTSTVGRWIKSVLSSAGIDTSALKAHSARGAAVTNTYIKGVRGAEILRSADWTNERTRISMFALASVLSSRIVMP